MRRIALLSLFLLAGAASAADRVAYVPRQVVRYEGDRAVVVDELVATVVSDPVIVEKKQAAPAVAAAQRFQPGEYHAGHDCPNCGVERTRIADDSGPNHTHICNTPGCDTWWYHVDAVSAWPALKIRRR